MMRSRDESAMSGGWRAGGRWLSYGEKMKVRDDVWLMTSLIETLMLLIIALCRGNERR
jgi:hypothetical protein